MSYGISLSEEKYIKNLKSFIRQRKYRIVIYSIFVLILLGMLIWEYVEINRIDSKLVPECVKSIASSEYSQNQTASTLLSFYKLTSLKTKLEIYGFWNSILLGFFIALIIIEFINSVKHRLIITMLEKIQRLEKEIDGLKKAIE